MKMNEEKYLPGMGVNVDKDAEINIEIQPPVPEDSTDTRPNNHEGMIEIPRPDGTGTMWVEDFKGEADHPCDPPEEEETKEEEPKEEEKKEEKPVEPSIVHNDDAFANTLNHLSNMMKAGVAPKDMDEDTLCVFNILERIRKDNGAIKFSPYNKATPKVKDMLKKYANSMGAYDIRSVQSCAKILFGQLYQDQGIDEAWKNLQLEVKKANRMPESLDIYGSVLFDKMVDGSLIRYITLKKTQDVNDEKVRNAMDVYQSIVSVFLDQTKFISMMSIINDNISRFRRNIKNIKRTIDDITYILEKNNISISEHTSIKTLYGIIKAKYKNDFEANCLISGIQLVLEANNCNTRTALQTVFLQHMILGVVAYINPDKEVQTEFGKELMKGFKIYIDFCNAINEERDTLEYIKSAIKEKDELYDKEYKKCEEKVDNDLLDKKEESTETPAEAPNEESKENPSEAE